jgi:F-type H+-transporting ATPase subunit b
MLIDWFTVGAQILNFLILVWLMKRFLYKPILLAIDTREKAIADQLAQAAAAQSDAKKLQDDFQHKTVEFDGQRAALLTKATDEAKVERQKLLDQARADSDTLRAQQKEALDRARESVGKQIAAGASREAFAIARKVLTDLAESSLEERMADVFVQRLRAIKPEDRGHLVDAISGAPGTAIVRSAFELPPAQQAKITSAVNDTTAMDAHVKYETVPDLVSGIELSTTGYKVSWNADDYLAEMEKSVTEIVGAK